MEQVILGVVGSLAAASIIAIVALAFKNTSAYVKLAKFLSVILFLLAVGYAGYGIGSDEGGKWAIAQIESGTPAADVSTLMPWWPLLAIFAVIALLFNLTWFPEMLGIQSQPNKDQEEAK